MATKDPYGPLEDHPIIPIRIADISNDFWRPKEIVQRLPEVTVRQIADLAEKEIITPAIDASGAGTSRLYDNAGLYSILVALSARNFLKHSELKILIDFLIEEEFNTTNIPIMCLIWWIGENKFRVELHFKDNKDEWAHNLLELPWHVESIKEYSRHLINLNAIKYNLRSRFKTK